MIERERNRNGSLTKGLKFLCRHRWWMYSILYLRESKNTYIHTHRWMKRNVYVRSLSQSTIRWCPLFYIYIYMHIHIYVYTLSLLFVCFGIVHEWKMYVYWEAKRRKGISKDGTLHSIHFRVSRSFTLPVWRTKKRRVRTHTYIYTYTYIYI